MANKNHFINGITELLILSILDNKDSYVYEIAKTIENNSDNSLSISQNTIYTAAYKLEHEKKIREYSKLVGKKRTRIYYHIEKEGHEYLKELKTDYYQMISSVQNILDSLTTEEWGG